MLTMEVVGLCASMLPWFSLMDNLGFDICFWKVVTWLDFAALKRQGKLYYG